MVSLTLAKRYFQRKNIGHVNSVRFRKQEAFMNVLVHNFIVICSSMKLHKISKHVKRIFASRNYHGKVRQSCNHLSSKLS